MIKYFSILYTLLLFTILSACKQEPDTSYAENYRAVYMAKSADLQTFVFQKSAGTDKIFVGANYGGIDRAPEDIRVKFEVDQSLVDDYNNYYGTDYLPLPSGNIDFSQKEALIKTGDIQTEALPVAINFTGLATFTNYLLPVKISSVSGSVALKENLKTTYFRIEVRSTPVQVKIMALGKGGTNNDMDKLAQIIQGSEADIVVIREIDKNTTRSGAANDWPAILEQKLGSDFNTIFAPSILAYQGGQYGMAVYSKFPISNEQTYRLAANGANQGDNSERGPFTVMDLDVQGEKLQFAAVHTNANGTARATQLGEMMTILGNDDGKPSILAGNMNANPTGGDSYAALAGIGFQSVCSPCQPNFSASNPTSWSDMVLTRGTGRFSVISHTVGNGQQTVGGTHLPIFTTLNVYF